MNEPQSDAASDHWPIDGCVGDRRAALAGVVRAHGDAIHRVASTSCGVDRAADVTQEVFLRFWRHPERFDPTRGTLRTYLLTIGRSVAIDLARADAARQTREHKAMRSGGATLDPVDDRLLRDEAVDRVRSALRQLPERERDAIATAFYGECSYRVAAMVLGESEGTVKSRIRAGLRHLRAVLDDTSVTTLDGVPVGT